MVGPVVAAGADNEDAMPGSMEGTNGDGVAHVIVLQDGADPYGDRDDIHPVLDGVIDGLEYGGAGTAADGAGLVDGQPGRGGAAPRRAYGQAVVAGVVVDSSGGRGCSVGAMADGVPWRTGTGL